MAITEPPAGFAPNIVIHVTQKGSDGSGSLRMCEVQGEATHSRMGSEHLFWVSGPVWEAIYTTTLIPRDQAKSLIPGAGWGEVGQT